MPLPLFLTTQQLLFSTSVEEKIQGICVLFEAYLNEKVIFDTKTQVVPEIIAGLPRHLHLVNPRLLKRRRLHNSEGRAALIHAIIHIEFNAINLALDAIYRFRDMPHKYYGDWLRIAREEAYHFCLLEQHLNNLGYTYGDFPAHLGLWEMAQKTGYDVLARMALVPRLLEARGLDVTPGIANRLRKANDMVAVEILGIIFHDEIEHVKVGNYWYQQLCTCRQVDPMETFAALLKEHAPDFLRGPLARETRLKAGFNGSELDLMLSMIKMA